MNGYICFYNNKRFEVYAENKLQAQEKAAVFFKLPAKRAYQIAIALAEKENV